MPETHTALTLQTLLAAHPNTSRPEKRGAAIAACKFCFCGRKDRQQGIQSRWCGSRNSIWRELAIVTFLQAKAYGKPYVLMPAVVVARGQHHTIFYNPERGHLNPGDLNGRKVGVRAYTQTTGAWVRGFLQEDYGVDFRRIQWITFEDPHVAEFTDPPWVRRAPEGKQLLQMLLDGEIDAAIFGSENPEGTPLKPLIPNAAEAAARWAEKHGGLPINHMMVSQGIDHAKRARMLFAKFTACSRRAPPPALEQRGRAAIRRRGGAQIARNHHSVFRRQGLIPRRFSVDELFNDVTRSLD